MNDPSTNSVVEQVQQLISEKWSIFMQQERDIAACVQVLTEEPAAW